MVKSFLKAYNQWRRDKFPATVTDVTWRHATLERRLNEISSRISANTAMLGVLAELLGDKTPARAGGGSGAVRLAPKNGVKLPFYEFSSKAEFDALQADLTVLAQSLAAHESKIIADNGDAEAYSIEGVCIVCGGSRPLLVDYTSGGDRKARRPVFRERLSCPTCNLNSRMRGYMHIIEENIFLPETAAVYVTEQTTPLFPVLQRRFPLIIGSEFLADGTAKGAKNAEGVRFEDATRLTFTDGKFDAVLSFECLEHIADYHAALREFHRVLRPDGLLMLTAPFHLHKEKTLTRAIVTADGTTQHIEPPEYHGDPINNAGILCYYHFGWDLLDDLRAAGFARASVAVYGSRTYGYFGGLQYMILARR